MGSPPEGNTDLIARLKAEGSPLSLEAAKIIEELDEEVYDGWEVGMGEDL